MFNTSTSTLIGAGACAVQLFKRICATNAFYDNSEVKLTLCKHANRTCVLDCCGKDLCNASPTVPPPTPRSSSPEGASGHEILCGSLTAACACVASSH